MRRYWVAGAVLLFIGVFFVVRSRHTIAEMPIPGSYLDPGYEMFPTPRTSDAPGTIYRKDKSGRRYVVTTKLIPLLPPHESDEEFGEFTTRHVTQVSTGGLIGMLFPTELPLPARAGREREVSTQVAVYGAHRAWTEDIELAYALLSFDFCPAGAGGTLDSTIWHRSTECPPRLRWPAHRKDNTFYIIRETIAAESLDFRFSDTTVSALGGEADLKEQVARFSTGRNPALSWRDEKRYVLTRRFSAPRRVYFLAERIDFAYLDYIAGQPFIGVQHDPEVRDSGWVTEGAPDPELQPAPEGYVPPKKETE